MSEADAPVPEDDTPVLVGCGDLTDTETPAEAGRSPFELMAEAARKAVADTGAAGIAGLIDTVAVPRLFSDSTARYATRLGTSTNPPMSAAKRLGIAPARCIYTQVGGNTPQTLVNRFAAAIAGGEMRAALIVGAEALRTQLAVERAGLEISWAEDPGGTPEVIGSDRPGWSAHERDHGLNGAIAFYPLIENALRGRRGRTVEAHLRSMAGLMARLARVAADNPRATRRRGCTAERLARIDEGNRWIGFPYPRLMNANVFVDQAAALIMTSVGTARELGIPSSRWVFLHGHADCTDHWYLTDREHLDRSPAIRLGAAAALEMAGCGVDDLAALDLYSCFPSAIEVACEELGIAENDPRGVTVTGGLPYFGGPGNNYVTHSIAEMVRRVRAAPGRFGLVSGNGFYLTKHAFGIYSTAPVPGRWQPADDRSLQAAVDATPTAAFTPTPRGAARVESYTVMHGRHGPNGGIVVGRETESGRRFVANPPDDPGTLLRLRDAESLGLAGQVRQTEGRNIFQPD